MARPGRIVGGHVYLMPEMFPEELQGALVDLDNFKFHPAQTLPRSPFAYPVLSDRSPRRGGPWSRGAVIDGCQPCPGGLKRRDGIPQSLVRRASSGEARAKPGKIVFSQVYVCPIEPFPKELQGTVVDLDKLKKSD